MKKPKLRTTSNSRPVPSVYEYHDYRKFLQDWLSSQKGGQSPLSIRRWAERAGLAASYLSMIMGGSRPLTQKTLRQLRPTMGLNQSEFEYLEKLVSVEEAKTSSESVSELSKLQKLRAYQKSHPKEFDNYQYLARWYCVAIREMADLKDFKLDAPWIQKRLQGRVELAEIKKAIDFLLERKFLIRGENDQIEIPEKTLECRGGVYRISLGQFHREMFDLAAQSIDQVNSKERHLLGHTVTLTVEGYEKAVAIIEKAIEDISNIDRGSKGDRVVQIQAALFPLTKLKAIEP